MAWKKDGQIRVEVALFQSIFPEQTKTFARTVVWSIICLADVILCVGGAFYFGVLSLEKSSKWNIVVILIIVIAIFWLQGKIWYSIMKIFRKKE